MQIFFARVPRPAKLPRLRARREAPRNKWKFHRPLLIGHPAITSRKAMFRSLIEQRNAAEGIPMDKKWRVSNVELLEGGLLFGFALNDQKGMPCVSFG